MQQIFQQRLTGHNSLWQKLAQPQFHYGTPIHFRCGTVALSVFTLATNSADDVADLITVFFHAVSREPHFQIRLEYFFHKVKELITCLLDQLAGLHLTHQLTLALLKLGNDIGKVTDNTFGIFVGIKQIMYFGLVEKSLQAVAGIAGIAIAGAKTIGIAVSKGLGNKSSLAAESVGALQAGLINLLLQPAMFQQTIDYKIGQFTLGLEAALAFIIILVAIDYRCACYGFLENINQLFTIQC